MQTFTSSTDDIDEFTCNLYASDWQHDFMQLSPGPLKFSTRVVVLPGITLFWNHFGARMRITESNQGNDLVFGFILKSDKPFLFNGHEMPRNNAAIEQKNTEINYVIPANLDSLMIYVDPSLVKDAGLHLSNTVEKSVAPPALVALIKECRTVTNVTKKLGSTENDITLGKELRNRVLTRLIDALAPWTLEKQHLFDDAPPPGRDYLLFKNAEYEMHKIGLSTRPSIDQLAGILEVSKRSLFYAFNKWVGMGPNAYFELLRLHYVRDRLLAGNPSNTHVTEVANELGFNHLGRFSGQYYKFFGEHPRDSLNSK